MRRCARVLNFVKSRTARVRAAERQLSHPKTQATNDVVQQIAHLDKLSKVNGYDGRCRIKNLVTFSISRRKIADTEGKGGL